MPIAAKVFLFLLKSKRGRKLLIGTLLVLIAAVALVILMATSALAAMFSSCKEQLDEINSSSPSVAQSDPSQEAVSDIPDDFLKLYQEKAEEYGIDWALLAAVGKQETNHGQDYSGCATSEDGARGPMQFIPSTWQTEGVDGNGDGTKDPCNEEDAIASGASYLKNLGAAEDPKGALCSYHGQCGDANANYAEEVLAQAEAYRGSEQGGSSEGSGEDSGGSTEGSGSGTGTIPPLMSKAYAAGVSDTPAGWSLVEPDKTMTYYSETRFDSYVEAAVEEWNSLGGVDIQPADSAEQANLVFVDVEDQSQWEYGWAMGYTRTTEYSSTKGEILINVPKAESANETVRKALMVHEMGHALGFQHQNGKKSVMNQDLQTDVPTEMDVQIYKETWGGEGSPANADPSSSYGEEEMSPECSYSFWPWAA